MYNIGDKMFYPMHGAGVINSIEEKNILGNTESYLILEMPGGVKIMIPAAKAQELGVRPIVSEDTANKVFDILGTDETEMDNNWNKRYRDNMERMKSGDIYEIADIVRNLSFKQREKGLSTGERKMLQNAKKILVSELTLAKSTSEDDITQMVDTKINTSFNIFRTQNVEQESIVKKFIPFEG